MKAIHKTQTIRVDKDVMIALVNAAKKYGLVFTTPNRVLRRVLGIDRK
jgi:hypothetical protein